MQGSVPVSLTIRRAGSDGEPRFAYELRLGDTTSAGEVRYGYYPSQWFLTLFPGGWQAIAQRENFQLPKDFPALPPGYPPLRFDH